MNPIKIPPNILETVLYCLVQSVCTYRRVLGAGISDSLDLTFRWESIGRSWEISTPLLACPFPYPDYFLSMFISFASVWRWCCHDLASMFLTNKGFEKPLVQLIWLYKKSMFSVVFHPCARCRARALSSVCVLHLYILDQGFILHPGASMRDF